MLKLPNFLREYLFDRRVASMRRRAWSRDRASRMGRRLIELERFEDADGVLEPALARWPGQAGLLDLHAMSAHCSGRFETALQRWESTRQADPGSAMAWCGIVANLRMLERPEEAEKVIVPALERFPDDLVVASEAARVFDDLGRHAEAAAHWRRLFALGTVDPDWCRGLASNLIKLGQLDEAESILVRALEQFPDEQDLLGTRADLEMERGNWNAALALWKRYRELYPNEQAGWNGEGDTIAAIHFARCETDAAVDPTKVDIETFEDDATRGLLLEFESIGTDCEFGLVQRRFGAEPLGLLRFNDVKLPDLLNALEARFDGMGDPDNTILTVTKSGEYFIADRRWGLGMHTFMYSSRYDTTTILAKFCRRIVFLRDKLLADLAEARKVFVFKTNKIDLHGLLELHRACLAYGPVRLLQVRDVRVPLSDRPYDDAAPGRTISLGEGLHVGFLRHLGNASDAWDIAFDDWVAICGGLHSTCGSSLVLPNTALPGAGLGA